MIEIYFSDLSDDFQEQLLEHFGVNSPSEMNWDVIPVGFISEND